MKKLVVILTVVLFIFIIIYSIFEKEETLKNGNILRLELAPVDPRSILQGDYMRLNFRIINIVNKELLKTTKILTKLVISLDKNNLGTFSNFFDKKELQNDEILLNFTYEKSKTYAKSKISTTSYFFEEGSGEKYEKAKYGEFRVSKNGEALLINLLDKDFKVIR